MHCLFLAFRLRRAKGLLSDAQFLNDVTVSFDVGSLQIIEKSSSLTYQANQRTFGRHILVMDFRLLCQMLNSVGEQMLLIVGPR